MSLYPSLCSIRLRFYLERVDRNVMFVSLEQVGLAITESKHRLYLFPFLANIQKWSSSFRKYVCVGRYPEVYKTRGVKINEKDVKWVDRNLETEQR